MILVVITNLGHFIALCFADLTLIACNTSSAFLMNVGLSIKYLDEKFVWKYDMVAIILVMIGTIMIILLSNKDRQVFTVQSLLETIMEPKSIAYLALTFVGCLSVPILTPYLLKKIRKFEQDCDDWEASHPGNDKVLPERVQSSDDADQDAVRPERVLIEVLYGLPKESVMRISPESLTLKTWVKLPMVIFATLAAMTSSISELCMKVVGCIFFEAEVWTDYLWLIPFLLILVLTAMRTLIYVNYGIKYYSQMEVMPVYQTSLL